MTALETHIKQWAHELGFELAGIAPATEADGFERLRAWLDRGYAGDMAYLHRHREARRHPASILPEVRSVVMVGRNYAPPREPPPSQAPAEAVRGRVARYAWGADYHDVLRRGLDALLARIQEAVPGCRGRGVVDTAPLLERDFARRAGLGWFGKNTMLLNRRLGSYFFLGALLLDLELRPDPGHDTSHCGTCTACLDACPTGAFVGPYELDARRCLSYLTIELKGPVPPEWRGALGDWVFGCDVCQEVCPWNRKAPPGADPALAPRSDLVALDLVELLGLSEEEFRHRFRNTALWRTRRRGLVRNAALILGERGGLDALPALRRTRQDPEPVVRAAAEWALARILERWGGTEEHANEKETSSPAAEAAARARENERRKAGGGT